MKLDEKVALITGAGSGLGRQSSLLFAAQGAKIGIVDIDGDRAEQTLKLVEQVGGDAIAITADVADKEQITAAVEQTLCHFGKLDIAWANAGVVSRGGVPTVAGGEFVAFEDLTEADWQHVLGVNLSGVVYTAQAAVPALKANGGGVICGVNGRVSQHRDVLRHQGRSQRPSPRARIRPGPLRDSRQCDRTHARHVAELLDATGLACRRAVLRGGCRTVESDRLADSAEIVAASVVV